MREFGGKQGIGISQVMGGDPTGVAMQGNASFSETLKKSSHQGVLLTFLSLMCPAGQI